MTLAAEATTAGDALVAILIGVVLLALNGYFVAIGIALVAARRGRVEEAADRGDRRARMVLEELDRLGVSLSGSQLGITMASLGLGAVLEPALAGLIAGALGRAPLPTLVVGAVAVGLSYAVVVFLHMVVGEMAPKNLALARAERVAMVLIPIHRAFLRMFRPLIALLSGSSRAVVRLLGVQPAGAHELVHTPEELALVLGEAHRRGTIAPEDVRLLSSVLRLSEVDAGVAMTPRVDMAVLSIDATVEDALALAAASGHTRLPVLGTSVDDVVGLVHVKDLLVGQQRGEGSRTVDAHLRPIPAVPESRDLEGLLREMLERRTQLMLVVDEFGGTAGLVSLEDVVEELVGDINDEFDADREVLQLAPGVWSVDGGMRREVLRDLTGLDLDGTDAETLSGWMVERLGRLVVRGDRVDTSDGWRLTVRSVQGRRAGDVEVRAPRVG